jgi:hypothetical protein
LEDRQSIERISGKAIQSVQNSKANGRAAAESARWRDLALNFAGERKRSRARFFEKEPRCFTDYARRTASIAANNRDAIVKTQCHAQAIEAGAEIRSAGRNLDSDFSHRSRSG